jgi:hypothetical protein
MEAPAEWNWQGKTEVLGKKTCPSDILFTTNPIWKDPASNTSLRGERLATNGLSYGQTPVRTLNVQEILLSTTQNTPNLVYM